MLSKESFQREDVANTTCLVRGTSAGEEMSVRGGKYALKADDLLCFCQDLLMNFDNRIG
jgi:hypothetical protein